MKVWYEVQNAAVAMFNMGNKKRKEEKSDTRSPLAPAWLGFGFGPAERAISSSQRHVPP